MTQNQATPSTKEILVLQEPCPNTRAAVDDPVQIAFYRSWVEDAHEVLRECAASLGGSEKGRLIAVADVMQQKLLLPETRPDYLPPK
jgi:hypothetical protein